MHPQLRFWTCWICAPTSGVLYSCHCGSPFSAADPLVVGSLAPERTCLSAARTWRAWRAEAGGGGPRGEHAAGHPGALRGGEAGELLPRVVRTGTGFLHEANPAQRSRPGRKGCPWGSRFDRAVRRVFKESSRSDRAHIVLRNSFLLDIITQRRSRVYDLSLPKTKVDRESASSGHYR